MRKSFLGPILAGLAPLVSAQAQAPVGGKALFERRCGGCHVLDRDKEGPRLGGVYGRTAGTVATFEYSDALKKSKVVWTKETLERWLTDTEKVVPGNDMAFRVADPAERTAIIDYLSTLH